MTLLLAVVLLASLTAAVLTPNWSSSASRQGAPLQELGAQPADRAPLALTGPRGIATVAGLSETRPRTGQVVEPGVPGLASVSSGSHAVSQHERPVRRIWSFAACSAFVRRQRSCSNPADTLA